MIEFLQNKAFFAFSKLKSLLSVKMARSTMMKEPPLLIQNQVSSAPKCYPTAKSRFMPHLWRVYHFYVILCLALPLSGCGGKLSF